MTPSLVRVNRVPYSFYSTAFKIDNFPIGGVVSLEYQQKRTRKIIGSNTAGAPPLGRTFGMYSIPTFTLRMLREDAEQLTAYVARKAGVNSTSYGDATFDLTSQVSESSSSNITTAIGSECAIEGKKTIFDESVSALVEEFEISSLLITENDANGNRALYSTNPGALDALSVDYIVIEGNQSPGRATILDPKRQFGWDVRLLYGQSYATLVPKGDPPATFAIRFDLWDESQLPIWNSFSQYFKRALVTVPGNISSVTKALTIDHPILQSQPFAVAQCVVSEIDALNRDELGDWHSTVKFMEYHKPIPALQKAPGAVDGVKKTLPDAKSATQQETQAMKQYVANQQAEAARRADLARRH